MNAIKQKDLLKLKENDSIIVKESDLSGYVTKEIYYSLSFREISQSNQLMLEDKVNKEFYTFNLNQLIENYLCHDEKVFFFYHLENSIEQVLKKQDDNIKLFIKKELSKFINFQKLEQSQVMIAGGFIGELVCNYFYNTPIAANDIDIFIPIAHHNMDNATFLNNVKNSVPELEQILNNINSNTWKNDYYRFTHEDFELLGSYKKEKINYIFIKTLSHFNKQKLLDSFDINSCEILYQPKENKLIYNQNFIDFLSSKILKIKEKQRSLNSLLRLFKKQAHFKLSIYKEEELAKTCFQLITKHGLNFSKNPIQKIPFETKQTLKKTIKWNDFGFNDSNHEYIKENLLIFFYNNPHLFFPYIQIQDNEIVINFNLLPINMKKAISVLDNSTADFCLNLELYQSIRKELFQEKEITLKRMNNFCLAYSPIVKDRINLYKLYPRIVKEDFNPKKKDLEKIFHQHEELIPIAVSILVDFEFSFKELETFFKKLSKNLLLLGLLETEFYNNINEWKESVKYSYNKVDSLLFALEEYIEKNRELFYLVEPLDIGYFKHFMKELTSALELELEGNHMKHCVGGYSFKVKSGDCRIFHIKTKKGHSTLEISDTYDIIQHKAPSNKEPISINKIIAEKFVLYIKNKELEKKYSRNYFLQS